MQPHTRVVVLDTHDISAGPIVQVELPLRLHGAVHGNWVPEAQLAARHAAAGKA